MSEKKKIRPKANVPVRTPASESFFASHRVAVLIAALGLFTAVLAFGKEALALLVPVNSPPAATPVESIPQKAQAPAPVEHVVVHQSSTEHVLRAADNLIVTESMMAQSPGTADKDIEDTLLKVPKADGSGFYIDIFEGYCAPAQYRILNATSETIVISMAIYETDDITKVGIGPGERWVSDPLEDGIYVITDQDNRWGHAFKVDAATTAVCKSPD